MKDIVIPARTVRRELLVILGCFLASFCTNIGAVIAYHKSWTEIFTQIGYVLVIAVCIYALLWVIRLICLIIKKLIKR
jgi:hypothetical protein